MDQKKEEAPLRGALLGVLLGVKNLLKNVSIPTRCHAVAFDSKWYALIRKRSGHTVLLSGWMRVTKKNRYKYLAVNVWRVLLTNDGTGHLGYKRSTKSPGRRTSSHLHMMLSICGQTTRSAKETFNYILNG